ncbi:unnamed protein product, partial [Polarella glacialis]
AKPRKGQIPGDPSSGSKTKSHKEQNAPGEEGSKQGRAKQKQEPEEQEPEEATDDERSASEDSGLRLDGFSSEVAAARQALKERSARVVGRVRRNQKVRIVRRCGPRCGNPLCESCGCGIAD